MKPLLILICLLSAACSNLPPAIEDAPAFDLSYHQAIQGLSHYKNAPVRWGGTVIDVQNEQSYSLMQVLYYPVNSYGRPLLNEPSEGRFFVQTPEFLDPEVYSKDTEVTIAGSLTSGIDRTIGKKSIQLPLISASIVYQWPNYQPSNYYGGYGYGGYGYGGYGFGGYGASGFTPFYGYYGHNPYLWGYPPYW